MEKRLLRMVVGIFMVLLTAGIPGIGLRMAAAQDSGLEGDTAYTSPQIGYDVEWDGETWLYLEDSEDESAEGRDHIDVWSLEFLAILHITGFTDAIAPADQVQASLDNTEENTEGFELLEQIDGDGISAAAMTYEVNGEPQLQIVEVVDLDAQYGMEGTLVLNLMTSPDLAEDAVASLKDLVTLEGDPILASDYDGELSLQAGDDEEEDTNQDEDEDSNQDEDEDSNQDEDEDTNQDEEDEDTDSRNQDDEDEDTDSRDSDAETGVDGNVYTNAENGFTVEWDEDLWGAEELDEPNIVGVTLGLTIEGTLAFASFTVVENGPEDAGDCVDETAAGFEGSDLFQDFSPADDLDLPETDSDAEAAIFTTTLVSEDAELDLAYYIECREIDGNTLRIQIGVTIDSYEDLLGDIEDLLAGITVGSASTEEEEENSNNREEEEEEEENSNNREEEEEEENSNNRGEGETYEDPNYGFSLTYDPEIWTLTEVEEQGYGGASLFPVDQDLFVYGSFLLIEGYRSADECLGAIVDFQQSADSSYEDFEEAGRGLDAPESELGGESGLFTATFVGQDGSANSPVVYYAECVEFEAGVMAIELIVGEDVYEDFLPELERLLSGIDDPSLGGSSNADDDEEPADEEDEEAAEEDATDEDEESAFLPRNVRFVA